MTKIKSYSKEDWQYISLGLLYLAIISIWLIRSDFSPAHYDDTLYLSYAYDMAYYLNHEVDKFFSLLLSVNNQKPPLLIYFMSLVASLFGSKFHAIIFYTIIISLNAWLVYNIKWFFKTVYNNCLARNYALILLLLSPLLFGVLKVAYVESLLMNLILVSWTLAYKWKDDFNSKRAIILGLITALGFYTKITFGIFVLPCLAFLLLYKKNYQNFLAYPSFLLGFSICLPWYLKNYKSIFNKVESASHFSNHSDGAIFAPSTIIHYSFDLIQSFGILSFVLLLYLAIKNQDTFKKILQNKYTLVIGSGALVNFLAFYLVENKNERFQFVSLFLLIIVMSLVLSYCNERRSKYLLLSLQAILSWQFAFYNFAPQLPEATVLYATRPYKNLFSKELEAKVKAEYAINNLNFFDLRSRSKGDIYQHQEKNPASSYPNFMLFKAKNGVVAAKFKGKTREAYKQQSRNFLLALQRTGEKIPEYIHTMAFSNEQKKLFSKANFLDANKDLSFTQAKLLFEDASYQWFIYKLIK